MVLLSRVLLLLVGSMQCVQPGSSSRLELVPGEEEGGPGQGSGKDLDPNLAGRPRRDNRGVPHRADR